MHILLTNDDGPPNPASSPHVALFAQLLSSPPYNHTVSVVLPSTQRSWIGKAHLLPGSTLPQPGSPAAPASEHITPTYYDPATDRTTPTPPAAPYFVLVPGTPATCVQLGLFHGATLFPTLPAHHAPVDLVLSGPNHGRNTTAAFGLSSGTIGGALEAAVVGARAIAVSFAIFNKADVEPHKAAACARAARVVDQLARDWDSLAAACTRPEGHLGLTHAPDLYSVNVPLTPGLAERPARWTWMLDNKWQKGSLYQVATAQGAPTFQWAPAFVDLLKGYDAVPEDADGQAIRNEFTTVTPLRANFENVPRLGDVFEGEYKL